ncbi:MAG: hypothetical protein JWR84_3131 [Caulobacter sp.]|nr:hypothetical protein [Caulobacter sp.]
MFAAKLLIAVVVYGGIGLGMAWVAARVRWAALPAFPGGRKRLFLAMALAWAPWAVAIVAAQTVREAVDPHDQLSLWLTLGMTAAVAVGAVALFLLATHLLPPTRRLYRDLHEAGRATRTGGG